MDINTIATLIDMMEKSSLSAMEVEENGLRVRLESGGVRSTPTLSAPTPERPAPPVLQPQPQQQSIAAPPASEPADIPGVKEIRSPMVGVFHTLPDGKCEAGQAFKKGQTVCLLEAMKLMNEITIPEDGEIIWVAVSQGDVVEYDQLLLTYK